MARDAEQSRYLRRFRLMEATSINRWMRRHGRWMAALCCAVCFGAAAHAAAPAGDSASARMNAPGPDSLALAARAGLWDVVENSWPQPGAAPEIIRGQVAERRMSGLYLHEVLHPDGALADARLSRFDYLGFNRVTGRWEYLSMDARVPVGLMPAWSFDHDPVERIHVRFEPFAIPGGGAAVSGQLLRMEQLIEQSGPDAETKDQYFILADGSGTKWLAHRYAYVRRKGAQ